MAAFPQELFDRLTGVDLLLHAGDLDDPATLDELRQIAPVEAVRGNLHFQSPWPNDQQLPLFLKLEIEGRRVVVTHGHLSVWNTLWEKPWLLLSRRDQRARANRRLVRRLSSTFPDADVLVFGHSHKALLETHGGALFVNPGAVCPTKGEIPSVAWLTVSPTSVEAEIVPLR